MLPLAKNGHFFVSDATTLTSCEKNLYEIRNTFVLIVHCLSLTLFHEKIKSNSTPAVRLDSHGAMLRTIWKYEHKTGSQTCNRNLDGKVCECG